MDAEAFDQGCTGRLLNRSLFRPAAAARAPAAFFLAHSRNHFLMVVFGGENTILEP
jgi:hypothetical protein